MHTTNHTRNIVRLLISSGDYILVARYNDDGKTIFFLPGGGIEYNESVSDAATRELNEEMGITKADIESISPITPTITLFRYHQHLYAMHKKHL